MNTQKYSNYKSHVYKGWMLYMCQMDVNNHKYRNTLDGQDLMVNIQTNLRIYWDGSFFMLNIGMKYQIRLRITPLFSMDENLGKYSIDLWFCKQL